MKQGALGSATISKRMIDRVDLRAMIFDIDGTLVDESRGFYRCIRNTIEELGLPKLSASKIRELARMPPDRYLREAIPRDRWNETMIASFRDSFRKSYEGLYFRYAKPMPYALWILRFLSRVGIEIGAVTRRTTIYQYVPELLSYLGLLKWIQVLATVREADSKEGQVRWCLKRLGVIARQSMVVGDSPEDTVAGRSLGAITVAHVGGFTPKDVLIRESPDYLVSSLRELTKVIAEIRSDRASARGR